MADILGKPKGPTEQEIYDYLTAHMAPELEAHIKAKKLSISDCIQKCFEKGKKFETKSGKYGVAKISEEQHWKWVCDYFGIKYEKQVEAAKAKAKEPRRLSREKAQDPSQLSFADLLDF